MKFHRNIGAMAAIAMAFSLVACGDSEPSEAEMKSAIDAQFQQARDEAAKVAGGNEMAMQMANSMIPTVTSVKKIACKESSQKAGYNCDVEVVTTSKMAGESKATSTIRFVKGDKGWVASE